MSGDHNVVEDYVDMLAQSQASTESTIAQVCSQSPTVHLVASTLSSALSTVPRISLT